MKNKNLILIGIILTTWYIPFSLIIINIIPYMLWRYDIPITTILIMIIVATIYIIGILTLDLGLKKINI